MIDVTSYNPNTSVNIPVSGTALQGDSRVPATPAPGAGQSLSLNQGDVINGRVLSSEGQNVTISLGNGATLTASLADGVSLRDGSSVSLAVRGRAENGNILLSALNTNTAGGGADSGIMKILTSAGFEVSERTVNVVRSMMEEGMPVNKDAVKAMLSSLSDIPDGSVTEAVELKKMGLSPTPENLEQLKNYKEAEYRLGETAKDIGRQASDALSIIAGEKGGEEGGLVLKNVLSLLTENPEVIGKEGDPAVNSAPSGSALESMLKETVSGGEDARILADTLRELTAVTDEQAESLEKGTMTKGELSDILKNIPDSKEIPPEIREFIEKTASSPEQAAKALENAAKDPARDGLLKTVLKNPLVKQLVQDAVSSQMMVTPEETARKENVKHLYERMLTQADRLQKVMGKAASPGTEMGQSLDALKNNVRFINDINENFPYLQLPVKMDGGEAHGDLYVYANKKRSAAKKDEVTALLHLDMDHLGQLDVYLTLKDGDHLGTHFYLNDEESLDLIAAHIDELEKGMEKRGYTMKAELSTREEMIKPVDALTDKESVPKQLSFTSFDARA